MNTWGAKDGAFIGMMLYPTHGDAYLGAEVLDVGEHKSRVRFTDCSDGEAFDMPAPGWNFSTFGPFKEFTGEFFDLEELHWFDQETDEEPESVDNPHEGD